MWHLKSTIVEEDVGRSLWWFVFVVGDITKGDLTQMQVKSNVFKILFWSKSLDKPKRFMGKLKDFLPSPCPCWRRIVPSPGEKSVYCEQHSWIWRRTILIIKARLSVSLTLWESRLSWQILKGRRTCCRWRMDPVVTIIAWCQLATFGEILQLTLNAVMSLNVEMKRTTVLDSLRTGISSIWNEQG